MVCLTGFFPCFPFSLFFLAREEQNTEKVVQIKESIQEPRTLALSMFGLVLDRGSHMQAAVSLQ